MLSGIVAFSACGNKTANNDTQQDSVQAADTTATDTTVTAESRQPKKQLTLLPPRASRLAERQSPWAHRSPRP